MNDQDQTTDAGQPDPDVPDVVLFDNDDVENNDPPAPDGVELTDAEVVAIRASQADPTNGSADAMAG